MGVIIDWLLNTDTRRVGISSLPFNKYQEADRKIWQDELKRRPVTRLLGLPDGWPYKDKK